MQAYKAGASGDQYLGHHNPLLILPIGQSSRCAAARCEAVSTLLASNNMRYDENHDIEFFRVRQGSGRVPVKLQLERYQRIVTRHHRSLRLRRTYSSVRSGMRSLTPTACWEKVKLMSLRRKRSRAAMPASSGSLVRQ
jgi:hypothetical protein